MVIGNLGRKHMNEEKFKLKVCQKDRCVNASIKGKDLSCHSVRSFQDLPFLPRYTTKAVFIIVNITANQLLILSDLK